MFVIQTTSEKAARKMSVVTILLLLITLKGLGPLVAIFTMHLYARPPRTVHKGLRIFGYQFTR